MEYRALEPTLTTDLAGSQMGFKTSDIPTLFSSASLIYVFFFVVIVVAASFRYAYAGMLRMQASEKGIKDSKEEFSRVTYGLLGVFSLWLILATVNKDMLSGDIGLDAFKLGPSTSYTGGGTGGLVQTGTNQTPSSSGTQRACENESSVKSAIISPGGICGQTACTILSGCKYTTYLPFIKSESIRLGVDYKMIVVTLCRESGGNPDAKNKNPNNTYDCGLMQINQVNACDISPLSPQQNITKGIEEMKKKINLSSNARTYPGIPQTAGIFASYNCCANGKAPNEQSIDCTSTNGWPSVPRWACPINPGPGIYNMCAVKAYACQLTACLSQVP